MQDELTAAEWLLEIALSPGAGPKLVAFGELVQRGLARISDLAELRAAGMPLYELEGAPSTAPRVWIDCREFIAAAALVAELRDASEGPGHVH